MNASNEPERLESIDLVVEGNEDLSIRPWMGPPTLKVDLTVESAACSSHEGVYVLIVNSEDLTVRAWQQAGPTSGVLPPR